MLILHGGLIEQQFVVWGETDAASVREEKKPRGGKSAAASVTPSPFDAGLPALQNALAPLVAGLPEERGRNAPDAPTPLLWLPTANHAPIPSSPLIAPLPEPDTPVTLAAWRTAVLPLSWEQTALLLEACRARDTLDTGLLIGSTLLYWTAALRFAGSLLARQQFLPDVEPIDDGFRACWRPLLAGIEADTLEKLARAMPSACRALSPHPAAPPDTPAVRVLARFLVGLCDHLLRSQNVSPTPVLSPVRRRPRVPKAADFDSLHEQWLAALRSPDGQMQGSREELAAFAAQVRDWQRPLSHALNAPFRLCFRLEEPVLESEDGLHTDDASAEWYVRYLLQSVEDPSLFVPAENAWSAPRKGGEAALLKRDGFDARAFLLASLGQASKLSPAIEASLKAAKPGGCALDTAGAQQFLLETAWLLEQSGFVVQLPAWWTRKGGKLRLTARGSVTAPKLKANAGLSMETIVQFDWQVALGGEVLTREELELLASQKVSLVRVRGQWVQLDAREIEAALAFWKKRGDGTATVRDVMRMALGAEKAPGGLTVDGIEASGAMGELLAQMQGNAALEPLPVPAGFCGTLRPYQQRGYEWLRFLSRWGLGACLADDMGLGKTAQTLAAVQAGWEANAHRPTLVICPTSVVGNWYREAQRFTPELPVLVHHGLTRTKGAAFQKQAAKHALVLSSFALLHRDLELLQGVQWNGIILDEAQNIKNPETRQSKAARALQADWRVALTGTPVENHVGDLWAILDFLNPGFLGSQKEFKRDYFVPIQANQDVEAAEQLKRVTRPFLLRRLKTDRSIIADLPDKMEMKVFCNLTSEQASLYEAVVKEATEELDEAEGIQRRGMILATLSKLKQVCNHPAQFLGDNSAIAGRSGKLARLTEMLEEVLASGDKALIFTQFTTMGDLLRKHLQETFGKEVLLLHGGVTKKQRDRMVERFQSEGQETPLFLLSLKAGGVGLNLTAANHVFHFDRWWNPAVENQATDRAFRIGQKKNVQVHKFLCAGTLEEKIDAMIESKRQVAANVVGTGEAWLTELSTNELKELFALRRDAVAGNV